MLLVDSIWPFPITSTQSFPSTDRNGDEPNRTYPSLVKAPYPWLLSNLGMNMFARRRVLRAPAHCARNPLCSNPLQTFSDDWTEIKWRLLFRHWFLNCRQQRRALFHILCKAAHSFMWPLHPTIICQGLPKEYVIIIWQWLPPWLPPHAGCWYHRYNGGKGN